MKLDGAQRGDEQDAEQSCRRHSTGEGKCREYKQGVLEDKTMAII